MVSYLNAALGHGKVTQNISRLNLALILVLIGNFLLMAKITWSQHLLHFNDYGFLNYILSSSKNGMLMRAPLPEDHNHFSVHLHLIFFLLLPFKWLSESGALLHFFQSLFLAMGGIPLYFICKRTGLKTWMTLAVTLSYYGNPYVLRNFMAFHYEPMVVPLLLGMFAFKLYGRYAWALFLGLAAFSVRDDYALLVGASSFAFAVLDRKSFKFWVSYGLMGVFWFFFARTLVMPNMHNPNGIHANLVSGIWGAYGSSYPEIIWYFLSHPFWVLDLLWKSELPRFLSFGLFIPLLSRFSLGVIPPMVYIATYPATKGELYYYSSAILLPFFYMGLCEGLSLLQKMADKLNSGQILGLATTTLCLGLFIDQTLSFRSLNGFSACFLFQCEQVYPKKERYEFADQLLKDKINRHQESVAVSAPLFPRVSWRRHLYEARFWEQYKPCWVILDMAGHSGNLGHDGREQAKNKLTQSPDYEVDTYQHDYYLFRKKSCAMISNRDELPKKG